MGLNEDYRALMETQLNAWKAQSDILKAGAARVEADARVQYEKHLEALRTAQVRAWDYFHDMKDTKAGAWGEFKAHMDSAAREVKEALDRLTSRPHE